MSAHETESSEEDRSDSHWPILLTALAGILGLLPMSLEIFWGSMPFALLGGLTVGVVVALLLLPAIPLIMMRRARRCERAHAAPSSSATDDDWNSRRNRRPRSASLTRHGS